MNRITPGELSAGLHFFTSDYFEGREAGTPGEKLAAQYLASCYRWMDIPAATTGTYSNNPLENYFQEFEFTRNNKKISSQNVIALLEGRDPILKKEAIIIVAHYDHLGKDSSLQGDQVFNGAADDGSGTVALLHIAKSFAEARKNGNGPKRSILFLHAGAEERGIQGSGYYVANIPVWPLEKTVAVINMDGVAGFDTANLPGNKNYVYLLYADSTSDHLLEKAKQLNLSGGIGLDILYPKNAASFGSDHQPFEAELVPTIYFSTGLTEHYHKVTDEASTIDYAHMAKITKLVFSLGWNLSNAPRIESKFNRSLYTKTGRYYCSPCGCSKDNSLFDAAGRCDACSMALRPEWKKNR
jgi:Zn-dependent M28 family amino/carboxypeptidase